ncbi:sperm-associated acrosin inhibitor-like isoform X1 [Ochotona princeps]|uniref:sperm-associated acrosin inhibitor-like isoform X1 n=1 Tax=Ochotona princeps TaxID=9978 RepID=UPI0027145584|nr:sperm-associated acrosin inhibitor-like isoform X1 [Ochotona princeps]XP_058533613.1 sperm-associated acrosin inhibitor-like isoform X1 [Ochotona princeps]
MPFFSPWITAVFIIFLTFPCHSETSFNQETEVRGIPRCDSYASYICNNEFDPVCASDGQTHGNSCMFCSAKRMSHDRFSFVHYGACSVN